jgi:hypothetical protein
MARRPKMPRPSCLVRRRQQPDSFAETRHLKARKEKKGRPNCKNKQWRVRFRYWIR